MIERNVREKSAKRRCRIMWPVPKDHPERPKNKDYEHITHWLFASDQRDKPVMYGCWHLAFFDDGRIVEGMQLHRAFD